jgi:CRP-like cAMP-binding protein
MPRHTCAFQNELLLALPAQDLAVLSPHLEPVLLRQDELLNHVGNRASYCYFLAGALVSCQHLFANGAGAEFALVGFEGMVGISCVMGGEPASGVFSVISPGGAFRVRDSIVQELFAGRPAVRHLLLRYAQAVITQIGQTAVCNRHHTLDKQFYSSLLLSLDRVHGDELLMTHEQMARRLGVRREGISEVAHKAQNLGLIRYRRGRIEVLDRRRVESSACECYSVVRQEILRLLPRPECRPDNQLPQCAECEISAASGQRALNQRSQVGRRSIASLM